MTSEAYATSNLTTFQPGNVSVNVVSTGNRMARVYLNSPDALGNNGTTPVMYVRPGGADGADRYRWVIYLQGGGSCTTGNECLQRWEHDQSAWNTKNEHILR